MPTETTTRCSASAGTPTWPRSRRPTARPRCEYHPDKNPGDTRGRGALQGGRRGLRGALRSREAAALRPVRQGRAGRRRRLPGLRPGDLRRLQRHPRRPVRLRQHLRRRRRRGAAAPAGRDLRYDLEIEFEEAVRGLETEDPGAAAGDLRGLRGQRRRPRAASRPAGSAAGAGQVAFQQGFFTIARPCGACRGTGRRITEPCEDLRGPGPDPARADADGPHPRRASTTGRRLRMGGEGEGGAGGGPPGDLYVVLHVREHAVFERRDRDLLLRSVPISFAQAALGAEIEVPTLDGDRERWIVPAGTQSGTRFRLQGHGVPALNGGGRGDQYVTVQVRTPDAAQRRAARAARAARRARRRGARRAGTVRPRQEHLQLSHGSPPRHATREADRKRRRDLAGARWSSRSGDRLADDLAGVARRLSGLGSETRPGASGPLGGSSLFSEYAGGRGQASTTVPPMAAWRPRRPGTAASPASNRSRTSDGSRRFQASLRPLRARRAVSSFDPEAGSVRSRDRRQASRSCSSPGRPSAPASTRRRSMCAERSKRQVESGEPLGRPRVRYGHPVGRGPPLRRRPKSWALDNDPEAVDGGTRGSGRPTGVTRRGPRRRWARSTRPASGVGRGRGQHQRRSSSTEARRLAAAVAPRRAVDRLGLPGATTSATWRGRSTGPAWRRPRRSRMARGSAGSVGDVGERTDGAALARPPSRPAREAGRRSNCSPAEIAPRRTGSSACDSRRAAVRVFDGSGTRVGRRDRGRRSRRRHGAPGARSVERRSRRPSRSRCSRRSAAPDRMDWVIQKATEIGVGAIHPFRGPSERTPATPAAGRLERWRRIAVEACKQSGRRRVPAHRAVRRRCPLRRPARLRSAARPGGGRARPLGAVAGAGPRRLRCWLAVGPESGFAANELDRALARLGLAWRGNWGRGPCAPRPPAWWRRRIVLHAWGDLGRGAGPRIAPDG